MAEHATAHAHGETHHTNYVKIWAILLVLLVVSVVGPEFGIRTVTLITAFGVAIVKAWMVAHYFMHLNIEKKWVVYIMVIMLAFLLAMVGGISPDVLKHDGHNWEKLWEEPAPGAGGGAH